MDRITRYGDASCFFCPVIFSLRVVPASKQSLAEHVIQHPDVMRQNCRPKTELNLIMPNEAFAKRIYSLQNKIVRELNNAHIFLEQAQPLLIEAKAKYENSKSKVDRRYYVPSIERRKFAKRTDAELKDIYSHYTSNGLFEAFLVNSVSQFESFLGDVIIEFLTHYPLRITETVQGMPACPNISPKDLVAATDKDELIQRVFSDHAGNVFRQRPSLYMTYLAKLLSVKSDPSFSDYYEVCATRDLVVHNNGIANALYVEKAGTKARGAVGEKTPVDQDYYYEALAKLKKVSGAIKRDIEKKYGRGEEV